MKRAALVVAAWALVGLLWWAEPASASTVRVEAESAGTGCTNATAVAGYSGTGYRECASDGAVVSIPFTIAAGETGTASVVVRESGAFRSTAFAVDGGTFGAPINYNAASGAWTVKFVTGELAAGAHSVEVKHVAAGSAQTTLVDYLEVTTSTAATTTTTVAPTTTTTVAPTTTTTVAPTTTTTAPPSSDEPITSDERDAVVGALLSLTGGAVFGHVLFEGGRR